MRRSRGVPLPIQVLPDELINQIAAGEVIERPASVVKELVENALDAGAQRIEVELERGGCGADPGARRRHRHRAPRRSPSRCRATPPARSPRCEDLERVATLGFRGEALPSIASVSRLSLDRRAGGRRACLDGRGARRRRSARRRPPRILPGTSVEVRDLFFNVPARRKFLRSEATEYQHIAAHARAAGAVAVRRRLLARAQRQDACGRCRRPRSAAERLARVAKHLRRGIRGACDRAAARDRALRVSGWLALPTFSRSQSDLQFAFLNGRFVRDKLHRGRGAPRLSGRAVPRPLSAPTCCIWKWIRRWSMSMRIRRSSKCVSAIRAACMSSCSAPWSARSRDTRPTAESAGSAPLDWLTRRARLR